jgi:YVTN family beta-propeller protein
MLSALLLLVSATWAQTPNIDATNWGAVTAPVFGTSEPGYPAQTELFAGPNKFGSYYGGVLPNGKIVKPVGASLQVGMQPLGMALTPDGRFLVSSNDNEKSQGTATLLATGNTGGFSLSVIDTSRMAIVSRISSGKAFVGIQITGRGPYTAWVSGGPDNLVRLFDISASGTIANSTPATIPIAPLLPQNEGNVSNYIPAPVMNTAVAGSLPPAPTGFARTGSTNITYPAGSALSPDEKFLYVACNGDNSVAVIDTSTKKVVRQLAAGYFPYGVAVSAKGDQVMVSNWGVTEYKFVGGVYDAQGRLSKLLTTPANRPFEYSVPLTDTEGKNPKTSSISLYKAPNGNGAQLAADGAIYHGKDLDELYQVGDTHPSAMAMVRRGDTEVLYFTKSNSDALGRLLLPANRSLPDFDLAPIALTLEDGLEVHGAYPNALAVSSDSTRLYVAEAGINSVAVLDTTDPMQPKLLGRIPTGWYPAALAVSADGGTLFVANAKGIASDENPNTSKSDPQAPATGVQSVSGLDSNFIFGTVQKVDLTSHALNNHDVLNNNYGFHPPADTSIVPAGGEASKKIKHVFFILHENKTFDSMLGNMKDQFGVFASNIFHDRTGKASAPSVQYTGVSLNTQLLARTFATAVNYYSDAEESDAGHQYAASGTATDYSEKTLALKSGRGLLVNKNFEPEDYPESGYIFNNAVRNGVSIKVFGDMSRLTGSDTGTSSPTSLSDPKSGLAGYPQVQTNGTSVVSPPVNKGDVTTPTQGLGQSYFMTLPGLAVLGEPNDNGEPRVDPDYPGYNFNISDQRRARRFIAEFDRMVASGTLPQFVYIYQPNDHTGSVQAANRTETGTTAPQQVADGDIGLGIVVQHIMQSPVYYDPATGEGSAIFITYDDAQSTLDHIHPYRTPLIVMGPYAKPGYMAKMHYSTASVVKTEELLLGLPPNNLGDLFATDLRDMFQSTYNGITADQVKPNLNIAYTPSPEGVKIWELTRKLDLSGPDRDSARLGALARLSMEADTLAKAKSRSRAYKKAQKKLYEKAVEIANMEVDD